MSILHGSRTPRQARKSSSAGDIVASLRISDVAQALGVKLDRNRRRCVASWRKGQNFSVSLDDGKNVWHDFVTGEGGGLVDFVVRVCGCDRRAALEWLAAYAGVALDGQNDATRRDWARRMRAAKPKAEALVRWKLETLEALRDKRNRYLRIYHNARNFLLSHDRDACVLRGDVRWDAAAGIEESYWPIIEQLEAQIDRLEAASYADLLERFGFAGVA